MANTIVERWYPQENFISQIEALGFTFDTYGWSGEDDEEYAAQDYFFTFPFHKWEDEEPIEGELTVYIEVNDDTVQFDLRVKFGTISEDKRIAISQILHELAKTTPEKIKQVTFHGSLLKDLAFYDQTIRGVNHEQLIEIASKLEFEKGDGSYDLVLQGLEGKQFAEVVKDLYDGFDVVPFTNPTEHSMVIGFNNKTLTTLSQLSIAQYFSTLY